MVETTGKVENLLNYIRDEEIVDLGVVKKLIRSSDVDINATDKYGKTALFYACGKKVENKELVEVLIDSGAQVNMLTSFNDGSNNLTPLMEASQCGNELLVELLIEKGAEVNFLNEIMCTALCYASVCKNLNVMKLLIAKGAWIEGGKMLQAKYEEKSRVKIMNTPLGCAITSKYKIGVELLLDAGASVNSLPDCNEDSLLLIAVIYGNKEIVDLLISRGADVNRKNGECEKTALIEASEFLSKDNAGIIESLLLAGAKPNLQNKSGKTALDVFVISAYASISSGFNNDRCAYFTEVLELLKKAGSEASTELGKKCLDWVYYELEIEDKEVNTNLDKIIASFSKVTFVGKT